ncbi:MAG: phosphohistidine phosphatase SixA [Oceanobacter sp.]
MKLILVRHGEAVPRSYQDAERPLTERGALEAKQAGVWLSQQMFSWSDSQKLVLLVSPYVRAQETATQIQKSVKVSEVRTLDGLTPDASPQQLLETLVLEESSLLLVSHMPLVGRLASLLTRGSDFGESFATGECRIFDGVCAASNSMTGSACWFPEQALG